MCKNVCKTKQSLVELQKENSAMLQFIEESGMIGAWLDNQEMYLKEQEGE